MEFSAAGIFIPLARKFEKIFYANFFKYFRTGLEASYHSLRSTISNPTPTEAIGIFGLSPTITNNDLKQQQSTTYGIDWSFT